MPAGLAPIARRFPFGAAGMAIATMLLVGVPAGVGTPWSAPYLWSCAWLLALGVAAGFYDILMKEFGCKRAWETERFIAWSANEQGQLLLVIKPYNGEPATVGNGTMVAFAASSKAQVEAVHACALALGGTDEGAVGPRGDNFYAGYFRDLDGHKLAVYFMG